MGQQQSNDALLFQQVSQRDVGAIKSLHRKGAGLEWVDKHGRTPLLLACTKPEFYDVARTLLDLGSNVNAFRSGYDAGTPLHHAAKSGLENTVKLLLSHGANPLVLNDNVQTPLDVARAEGYTNVVRAIESHICLFSGWMREFYDPSFLQLFASQPLSRRVWVVVVPNGSRNHTKPCKLELAVYDSLQDAQPRTVVSLWKANLEKPKSYQSDASVMIVDNATGPSPMRDRTGFVSQARRWARVDKQKRLKLAVLNEGDEQQLNRFCEACKGLPQELTPLVPTSRAVAKVVDSPTKENGDSRLCAICVDASYEAVCVPCGHVAGCVSCLRKIKDKKFGCPICRTNIDLVIKLYHV